jgi:hypothetical protein
MFLLVCTRLYGRVQLCSAMDGGNRTIMSGALLTETELCLVQQMYSFFSRTK